MDIGELTFPVDLFNSTGEITISEYIYQPSVSPVNDLSSFLLGGYIGQGWRLQEPIDLNIEIDELNNFVVYNDTVLTYGVGESLDEAIRDFKRMLIDRHMWFQSSPMDELAPLMQESRLTFESILTKA